MNDEELSAGLKQLHQDTQVGHGFAQLDLGASADAGLFARAEAGYRPLEHLDLFGYAEVGTRQAAVAGVGARFSF